MTHLRGEIEKVYEVLKKGYAEPITQTTRGYTITTGLIVPGVAVYNLPNIPTGKNGYIKTISVTAEDNTAIHNVYLTRISVTGVVWTFFTSFFFIGYEWNTGDASIADNDTWTLTLDNNAAGNVNFTINIYWIES